MDNAQVLQGEIKALRMRLSEFEKREPEWEKAEQDRQRYQSGIQKLDAWIRSIILAGGDYQRFSTLVCDAIQDLVGAELSMLPFIDEGHETFTYHAAAGQKSAIVMGKTMPLAGGGLCGWVATHGEALCVQDLSHDERVLPDLARALDVTTGLLVPLRSLEGVVGGLSAFRKGKPFDQIDEQLLTLFSQRITTALENMHLLRTLEKRVEERTAELTNVNSKLQKYADDLREANDDIKNFAYIVSHDLRAPLINIKGFVRELRSAFDMIQKKLDGNTGPLSEKERNDLRKILHGDGIEAIQFIESSALRMDKQINAILTLSRLGRRELTAERVDPGGIIQSILSSLSHQIEERRIAVTVDPLPEVIADKMSLEQIFGNLLDNAVKYLEPGRKGEIAITAEQDKDEYTFAVRDNGRGIAKEDSNKVFELFRRAGMQDVPGEGMGLAYVKTLVRRHGGRVWFDSEAGSGTTFRFTVPLKPVLS